MAFKSNSLPSAQALQLGDPPCGDPFRDVYVAVGAEAGVVGMDELAVDPCLGVAARHSFFLHHALDVFAELGDHFELQARQPCRANPWR